MADDRKKIDEDLRAQQIVDLVFARRVPTHQALQRCRFVGCEVVDVQIGIGRQASAYEVDKALERGSLLLPIGGPIARCTAGRRQHRGKDTRTEIPARRLRRTGHLRSRKRCRLPRVQEGEIDQIPRSEAGFRTRPPPASAPRPESWPAHESSRSFGRLPDRVSTGAAEAWLRAQPCFRRHA